MRPGELPDGVCPVCKQVGVIFLCEVCGARLVQVNEELWRCPACPEKTEGVELKQASLETKRILCPTCKVLTNHRLHASHPFKTDMTEFARDVAVEVGDDPVPIVAYRLSLWSCCGCGQPTLEWQEAPGNPETGDFADPEDPPWSQYFPPRSWDSIQPKCFRNLNRDLTRLYREVVTCFNEDCWQLCGIGLGELIQAICRDKGVPNIDGLASKVPDNKDLIEALRAFRESRNDLVHPKDGMEPAGPDDLRTRMGIVEDLLTALYDLGYGASQFRRRGSSGQEL